VGERTNGRFLGAIEKSHCVQQEIHHAVKGHGCRNGLDGLLLSLSPAFDFGLAQLKAM
jgi:hypothetical protein